MSRNDIAVIGMACRLPAAANYSEFWRNLREQRNCVREIPSERWDWREYFGELRPDANTTLSKWAGFIDDVDGFDAELFELSPLELEVMDPQQRIALELSWAALEDAALRPSDVAGRNVGVYLGAWGFDYKELLERQPFVVAAHHATGTSGTVIANRVSWFFDLHGPSLAIDTACSSSLYAIHQACLALRAGECDMALTGGVNLLLTPTRHLSLAKSRMLSPTGSSKSFDDAADGYARGEGAGVLLLKPLARAVADGDPIHGVIRGSATNHGGRVYTLTAPKSERQAAVIVAAQRQAEIDPTTITHIEAHGTGTPKGDGMEIAGLVAAFKRAQSDSAMTTGYCGIGSAKASIGHLEAAAGVAGVIKVLLSMRHGELPGLVHFNRLNHRISLEETPFYIVDRTRPWKRMRGADGGELPYRAGVSSFGFGGTNAHVVLEEYRPDARVDSAPSQHQLIVLSAKNAERLSARLDDLIAHVERSDLDVQALADLAYTLQVGRQELEERLCLVVSEPAELLPALQRLRRGETVSRSHVGRAARPHDIGANTLEPLGCDPHSLDALLECGRRWVRGQSVEWGSLHAGSNPRRVRLPTYPFARERYWIPPRATQESAVVIEHRAPRELALAFYREGWFPRPLLTAPPPETDQPSLVVAFGLSSDAENGFESCVRADCAHARVVFVRSGESFVVDDRAHIRMPWLDEAAHERLWSSLDIRSNQHVTAIHAGDGAEEWNGLRRIHTLARGLLRIRAAARTLVVLSPAGTGETAAWAYSWIGFRQSLRVADQSLRCSIVYYEGAQPAADAIWRERLVGRVVKYTPSGRLELDCERVSVEPRSAPLVRRGAYLVTGGCGGLGRMFAGYLAERCQGNLVLTGRRAADAEIESFLESLRARGAASAQYSVLDASDIEGARALVSDIARRHGRLHGIVHAAGVHTTRSIGELGWAEFREILAPKIDGTLALDEATRGMHLDFVSYISSTAAVLGDLGGCAYAVANRFQLEFGPGSAVCWPLWRSGGMHLGASAEADELYLGSSGQRYLEDEEGLEAWARLVAGTSHHIVLTAQPERASALLRDAYEGAGAVRNAAPIDLRDWIQREIEQAILGVLKIRNKEHLDETASLSEFGFDSVALTLLAARLSDAFDVAVTAPLFFSYSTIERLTSYFFDQHGPQLVSRASRESSPTPESREEEVTRHVDSGAIAVIGMAGRFPGAANVDALWQVLVEGRQTVSEVPADRWDSTSSGVRGGFIDGVDEFDALFFEISPREAALIDPRQRLLLEEAWHAFEDAGYAGPAIRGSNCGVFVGVEESDYARVTEGHGDALLTGRHTGILAARISYFLDLKGPNLAINTACSSGLVALHSACQALRQGDCELALAAGVNLMITPQLHAEMARMGMISPSGGCHAFSERADGVVASEAVVAMLCKPLSMALRDRDRIHAVVAGSGINSDGRTNGITAPNGIAQEALLRATYARHGVDPAQIDFVVAHGTGTRLGDPVEVAALANVFRSSSSAEGFCALGSFKQNLGHTCAASGLVSVVGAILALEHETIPGSPDCSDPNPLLALEKTPFRIETASRPWPPRRDGARRVAISAFGMSGTNAHAVLEEPPSIPNAADVCTQPQVFVLSAKDGPGLDRLVERWVAFLSESASVLRLSPRDVAYTLQLGRASMAHRLAIVASDLRELRDRLTSMDGVHRGSVARGTRAKWSGERSLDAIARAWVEGAEIDWVQLHAPSRPRRVGLPTYPFARERQKLSTSPRGQSPAAFQGDFEEDGTFNARLDENNELIRGHFVDGTPVLPGVAYLHIVRDAAEQRYGRRVRGFADVAWLRRLSLDHGAREMCVRWQPDSNEFIKFTVSSRDSSGEIVHAQGRLEFELTSGSQSIDLGALRARCSADAESGFCYAAYAKQGIEYAPPLQCLKTVRFAPSEVLVELRTAPQGTHCLSPRWLDAALQGVIGIALGRGASADTLPRRLPFSVARVTLSDASGPPAWAHIRSSVGGTTAQAEVVDIDVADHDGRVLISLQRVAFVTSAPVETNASVQTFRPVWLKVDPSNSTSTDAAPVVVIVPESLAHLGRDLLAQHTHRDANLLIVGDTSCHLADREWGVDARDPKGFAGVSDILSAARHVEYVCPNRPPHDDDWVLREGGLTLFRLIKQLGAERRSVKLRVLACRTQMVRAPERPNPWGASTLGLLLSFRAEYTHCAADFIDLDLADDGSCGVETLALLRRTDVGSVPVAAVRNRQLYARALQARELEAQPPHALRHKAVVLLIGGAGGLGLETAVHFAKRFGARAVIVGRRPEDAAIRSRLRAISDAGGEYLYVQADATDARALRRAYEQGRAHFGAVHGVVHAALVLADRSLTGMDEATFLGPLDCKLRSAVALREVLGDEALDFVLFHASVQSFLGNAGQANYAAGSTFVDALARSWSAMGAPVRSIQWGYWGEVGSVATPAYRERMARQGFRSISAERGMSIVDQCLAGDQAECVAVNASAEMLIRLGVRAQDAKTFREQAMMFERAESNELEVFSAHALLGVLKRVGLLEVEGAILRVEDLVRACGIAPEYRRLAHALLRILEKHEYIDRNSAVTLKSAQEQPPRTADALRTASEQLERHRPGLAPALALVVECIEALPRVLKGELAATQVLFPNGSTARVSSVYRDLASARQYNEHVACAVEEEVQRRLPHAEKVVIVEVGAGTGSASEVILERIARFGERLEYRYTDISKAFTVHGERNFQTRYPFVRCSRLDVQSPVDPQGYARGSADIVVAANVLHASTSVRTVLDNLAGLLRAQGLLIVNELVEFQAFTTLTFGLLPGWWLYSDAELRVPHAPLLSRDGWSAVLVAQGYSNVSFRGDDPAQVVILATRASEALEPAIRDVVSDALNISAEHLDSDTPFGEYGVDSIVAVRIVVSLNERLGTTLQPTDLFNYATIATLASYIATQDRELSSEPPREPIQARLENSRDVAVIGMSGRFPGAQNLAEFWHNIASGRDSIEDAAQTRWRGMSNTPLWAGLLDGIDEFDAAFFGIAPREARLMDPQQRLFLMECWRALEDAGYAASALRGSKCGVFVGCSQGDYDQLLTEHAIRDAYCLSGNASSILAARAAYHLDLKGPTLAVDTACSSSLVAIHLACESLRNGESRLAIAGGACVLTTPKFHDLASRAGMLSASGRCRTFSDQADGFVPSEGVGVVVLKPLSAAVEDGDHIYGVIRGSAVNQDGRTSGITAPNGPSQTSLECEVYERLGISADSISYVEAHGTGTKLGDPIEFRALTDAFRRSTPRRGFCALGSVKANIGHALTAAGVAGLLKILLAFRAREIPPSIHFDRSNDLIDLASSPFYVSTEARRWDAGLPRAAISSFGFSGTNAHLVVDAYEDCSVDELPHSPRAQVAVLSARTREELTRYAAALLKWCEGRGSASPADVVRVAYTLQCGRDPMQERAAFAMRDLDDLARKLRTFLTRGDGEGVWLGRATADAGVADRSLIELWRTGGACDDLAKRWVNGESVDWDAAYAERRPRRTPLPTYPFATRRFWFDDPSQKLTLALTNAPSKQAKEPARSSRQRVVLDAVAPAVAVTAEQRTAVDGSSAHSEALDRLVQNELASVLYLQPDEVSIDAKFRDLGLDSITAVELAKQLTNKLGLQVPVTSIYEHPTVIALGRYLSERAPRVQHMEDARQLPPAAVAKASESQLREILASVLLLQPQELPADANFLELGLDSITGVEFTQRVAQALGISLKVTAIYEHPTLARLSQHLGTTTNTSTTVLPKSPELPSVTHTPSSDIRDADIAVIGMSGRFAQAPDLETLWAQIERGVDCVREVPPSRFSLATYFDPNPLAPDKTYSKWLGAVDDIECFDAEFFSISPREAEVMDPQQRLFLEEAWLALEDAGFGPETLAGKRCSVYVGVLQGDYSDRVRASGLSADACALLGKSNSVLASRLAYLLDLRGASMAIDTACSSSLVAIHEACESLKGGRSDLAVAGGVYVSTTADMHVMTSKANMLSADGRCRAFDERADGFVIGEGVGVLVLKRLRDAVRDGDHVYAVVKASAVNQDGATNGLTAPSLSAQRELEIETYRQAGIDASDIQLVEAHGTGTKLGDPIEFQALTEAFREFTEARGFCALGSVKTQIGHTLAAAGVAGVIKVVLALCHRTLPPSLHFETPNSHIEFDGSPFFVNTQARAWERGARPRLAAVSSFGFSGTNAHVLIEEAPPAPQPEVDERIPRVVVLSAHSEDALRDSAARLLAYLRNAGSARPTLRDLAYTLQTGRKALRTRLALEVSDYAQLDIELEEFLAANRAPKPLQAGSLGARWMSGERVDWHALYRSERPRRVRLPPRRFARDRHWVAGSAETLEVERTNQPPMPDAETFLFHEAWVEATRSEVLPHTDPTVLYFDTVERIAELRGIASGTRVIGVSDGTRFARLTDDDFAVAWNDVDSLERIIRETCSREQAVSVVYRSARDGAVQGVHCLLCALKRSAARVDHILLIGVRGTSLVACLDEALIGWRASAPFVMPGTQIGVLYGDDSERVAAHDVWNEIGSAEIVRKHRGRREVLRAVPSQLSPTEHSQLRENGGYLIAGGTGALGRVLAEHLARRYHARIALLGRSALNPAIQAQLSALTSTGASRAVYIQADLSDADTLRQKLRELERTFGLLHGVVHAAGIFSPEAFFEKDWSAFERGLGAKVSGTLALDRATAAMKLDFFCSFSSIAAAFGDFGAGDYAVANRFQQAHARYREFLRQNGERSGRSIVVNWPLWAVGGLGALQPERRDLYLQSSGQRALESSEAMRIWESLLAADQDQQFVLAGDAQRIEAFVSRAYGPTSGAAPAVVGSTQPSAAALRREVRAAVAEVLKIGPERLRDDTRFVDFGFDSITLVELARRLGARIGSTVSPALLYNHSSIAELSDQLALPTVGHAERPKVAGDNRIAVIGFSGRFPGADSPEGLWDLLSNARCAVSHVPAGRWHEEPFEGWRGGFLSDVEGFDPLFFEISPQEAETMDPRQRVLLEEAWHAVESAGYTSARLRAARCAVFVGVEEADRSSIGSVPATSAHSGVLAARISYFLNLRGPNLAINTACSSGLVALHYACEALRNGESEVAIAAGVNLLLSPAPYRDMSQLGMMSPSGNCFVFDARADGIVPSESVAVLLLKPLADAVRDGDPIHAVVRASGVNHDGRTNGITAPNGTAQAELIRAVQRRGEVNPREVEYVIAHGTGTQLGDPIEFGALADVLADQPEGATCYVASLKANLGHSLAASGLVNMLGAILALKNEQIPPAALFERENPYLPQTVALKVPRVAVPWPSRAQPRIAATSAFGMSGTNAHVIIEDYPVPGAEPERSCVRLFPISAKDEGALRTIAAQLAEFLASDVTLRDVAFTLQTGRDAMDERFAVVAESRAELIESLELFAQGDAVGHRGSIAADREVRALEVPHNASREQLRHLAESWVQGAQLTTADSQQGARRITLPPYPFARQARAATAALRDEHAATASLRDEVVERLRQLVASTLKLPAERLRPHAPLERFGLDSLRIVALTDALEAVLGPVPKTLFFEHRTLDALADELLRMDRERLQRTFGHAAPRATAVRPKPKRVPATPTNAIAIIGLAGRYPKARNLAEFWENLCAGRDCIEEIPEARWNHDRYYDPRKGLMGKTYGRWGGFLNDVDRFDPLFFNISPKDAELMDPQERLFLETAWEAIEDAGYTREALGRRVGVYVGVMYQDYPLLAAERTARGKPLGLPGNPAGIANRVSYFCDFQGPSMAVDSMCSSSLTALHLACDALRGDQCEVAIAGGVNLSIHPNKYLVLGQGQFISSRGRCESFGVGGDGYVPSEGVGAVLLKPLERAIADRDHIYGVVRGSSLNHGGKTYGYTVPSVAAQAAVISAAFEKSGVEPAAISYVEAHGTGTSLGDPIEVAGLTRALESLGVEQCAIGSVKSNIGHCEAAAGIAGLTKLLLQLRYGMLVPSIHSEPLNAKIDFESTRVRVQNGLAPWLAPVRNGVTHSRVAGVSSFGAGGSNAHVVVEEYVAPVHVHAASTAEIVPVSARTSEALLARVRELKSHLEQLPQSVDRSSVFARTAYTLQVGREAMKYRVAWVVRDLEELLSALERFEAADAVRADEDNAELLSALEQRDLHEIAAEWRRGKVVDWAVLWHGREPLRASLPTYPFARKHYWLPDSEPTQTHDRYEEVVDELMSNRISVDEAAYQIVARGAS